MKAPRTSDPAAQAPSSTPASAPGGAPDRSRCYRFGHGFTYRREEFGGILYHYEGIRPDPHIMFVNHGFLIDLLDTLGANPEATLDELLRAVGAHCGLDAGQMATVEDFLSTLYRQGALVAA